MLSKYKFGWLAKLAILLCIGGLMYCGIELLYRGHTHWTMFIVGGLAFIEVGLINEIFPWDMYFEQQVLIGDILVTFTEFIAGYILNIKLGLGIWDYSNLPFNVMGQICLLFMFLWAFLVAFAIWLDDHLRFVLFKEEVLGYVFWIAEKFKERFKKKE